MNHDLLDYLLKTLLDLPRAERTTKKLKNALELVAELAGVEYQTHPSSPGRRVDSTITTDPSCTLIRISEVSEIVGLARATIYKLLNSPQSKFPRPLKLTDGARKGSPVGWVLSEVQDWTRSRTQNRCEYPGRSQE
jgi:prophage regulatory protein